MESNTTTKYFDMFDRFSGSILVSDEKGVVQYVNLAGQKRTGFYRAEIIGNNPGKMWGGNMGTDFYTQMWKDLSEEKSIHTIVKNTYKDALPEDEYLNILPIADSSKKYFVEIHPKDLTGHDILKIKNDFLQIAQSKTDPESVFEKIAFWLSGGRRIESFSFDSLFGFFEEYLLKPVQHTFSAREVDKKMIVRAQKNPEQFEKLYDVYYQDVFNYFLPRLGYNHDHAQDLSQEVFEKAFKHINSFTLKNASYKTYLLRIAHNRLVNEYRKNQHREIINEEWIEDDTGTRVDLRRALSDALSYLGKTEKEILRLRYFEDLSIHEIATELGKTENAVKLHLSRARNKLRKSTALRQHII